MTLQQWLDNNNMLRVKEFPLGESIVYIGVTWEPYFLRGYITIFDPKNKDVAAIAELFDKKHKSPKRLKLALLKKYKQLLRDQLDILKGIEL